jgi:hypothetical protein
METSAATDHEAAFGSPEALRINVVIAFEDVETGVRARTTVDRVQQLCGLETEPDYKFWKFDLLRNPHMRRLAALDASEAHVIVLSAHGRDPEWPVAVREWIAEWHWQRTDQPGALVVFLGGEYQQGAGGHPMLAFMEDIARGVGLEFFHRFWPAPGGPGSRSTFTQLRDRAERSSCLLEGILQHSRSLAGRRARL